MANGARLGSVGVIDIGSNTVLLLVLEQGGRVAREDARITRLGQGVFQAGSLSADAVNRTRETVESFAAEARRAGAERVVAVGTEALRRARDGREFLASISGVDETHLLSGEVEAACTLEAARRAGGDPPLVIDVGGGSTELAWADASGRIEGLSLPLGSVRLTEACLPRHPVPAADLVRARAEVETIAGRIPEALVGWPGRIVALAGTATTLAALELRLGEWDAERVEGLRIARPTLESWISELAQKSVEERLDLSGLEPGRADIIVGGLLTLDVVLGRLRAHEFSVSGRGVRHGVAMSLLDGHEPF